MGKGTRRTQCSQDDPVFLGGVVHLKEGLKGLRPQKRPIRDETRAGNSANAESLAGVT